MKPGGRLFWKQKSQRSVEEEQVITEESHRGNHSQVQPGSHWSKKEKGPAGEVAEVIEDFADDRPGIPGVTVASFHELGKEWEICGGVGCGRLSGFNDPEPMWSGNLGLGGQWK